MQLLRVEALTCRRFNRLVESTPIMRMFLCWRRPVLRGRCSARCVPQRPGHRGGRVRAGAGLRLRQEPKAAAGLPQARGVRSAERPALSVRLPRLPAHRHSGRVESRSMRLTRVQKMGRILVCADGWFWPFSRTAHKNEPPGDRDRDPAVDRQEAWLGARHLLGQHGHALRSRRAGRRLFALDRQGHLRHRPRPHRDGRRSSHGRAPARLQPALS